ncbi:MAG: AI-2E family transporter [Angelakisella sp.]
MKTQRSELKVAAIYGALLILLYWAMQNLDTLSGWFRVGLGLFAPFLLGLIIAFVINVPMAALEKALFGTATGKKRKLARSLSLVLTLLLVAGLIFVVLFLVVPELAKSITMLGNNIPDFLKEVQTWSEELAAQYPEIFVGIATIDMDWQSIINQAITIVQAGLTGFLTSIVSVASGVFSGLLSFFLALVFGIYVLLQKEKLREQAVEVLYAFTPKQRADRIMSVASLTGRTFSSFLTGQCVEAVILGLMFFVSMSIFRLPYTLLVSVLTGFAALIPIFGAFIGCAVGAFLILMVNPMQAVWFLLLFIIIQQVEGNLIYPRVVGGSIGLPSIWVLLAVTVGGSAMGIAGMLIFIPLCSVLYTLLWETVEKRKELSVVPEDDKFIDQGGTV